MAMPFQVLLLRSYTMDIITAHAPGLQPGPGSFLDCQSWISRPDTIHQNSWLQIGPQSSEKREQRTLNSGQIFKIKLWMVGQNSNTVDGSDYFEKQLARNFLKSRIEYRPVDAGH